MEAVVDRHHLGARLRTLRAAKGRTVASVAMDAGLSVPYVANLENGRGNPTVDALNRIAQALGTRATIGFVAETDTDTGTGTVALPATLIRLGRGRRFRRDIQLIADTLGEDPTALAARILDLLAQFTEVTGRDLNEADWFRLLDALILITLHPQPGSK
ncbi:helix-turn-helix domain-containing protein [Nonomuraea sp. CA-141351]|uniref:helix-turn-helix domain-containing protein n=1 Tax=Nonomuraea sp. CA-141351 TaxID=3239996 RepID=UPI003D8A2E0A